MIDRRAFLRRLGFGTVAAAAAATGVIDIERLLWMPGEKTILLPTIAEAVTYGNTFATVDWMARECLRALENKLSIAACFSREYAA